MLLCRKFGLVAAIVSRVLVSAESGIPWFLGLRVQETELPGLPQTLLRSSNLNKSLSQRVLESLLYSHNRL